MKREFEIYNMDFLCVLCFPCVCFFGFGFPMRPLLPMFPLLLALWGFE